MVNICSRKNELNEEIFNSVLLLYVYIDEVYLPNYISVHQVAIHVKSIETIKVPTQMPTLSTRRY